MSARRVGRGLVSALRNPYLAFVVVYFTGFVLAFSSLANFAILARERVQVLPMFFALLCVSVPPLTRFRAPARGQRELVATG
jgi:hypothetical protein